MSNFSSFGNLTALITAISNKIKDKAISNLKDVSLSSLSNGQTLLYDSTAQKWKNGSAGGASGAVLWTEREGYVGKNQFSVGNSISEWLGASNNGATLQSTSISTKVTATVVKDTNSITVTNYDTTGYWWGAKELFLKKNTDYQLTHKTLNGTIKIMACASGSESSMSAITWDADHNFNSGNYDRWFFEFYPSSFSCEELLLTYGSVSDKTFEPYLQSNDELAEQVANKVDKVVGKGLSTNDFTDAYKAKVDSAGNMSTENYAKYGLNGIVDNAMAVQLLYGDFDKLTRLSTDFIQLWDDTPTSYSFTFAGNSYAIGDNLVCFIDTIATMRNKIIFFDGYSYSYTDTNGGEVMSDRLTDTAIINETVPSDCDVTQPFTISVSIVGPVIGNACCYKGTGANTTSYPTSVSNTRFFKTTDGKLGFYNSVNGTFNLMGGGNPILPINPTDATYKSTPGAIWIET